MIIVYAEGVYVDHRYYENQYEDTVMGTGNTAGSDARYRGLGNPFERTKKTHCNVLLQCAFWFDAIWVSESLQQPILCRIGVLPFCRVLISQPVYSGSHRHGG